MWMMRRLRWAAAGASGSTREPKGQSEAEQSTFSGSDHGTGDRPEIWFTDERAKRRQRGL
jgi:hypothetical protein